MFFSSFYSFIQQIFINIYISIHCSRGPARFKINEGPALLQKIKDRGTPTPSQILPPPTHSFFLTSTKDEELKWTSGIHMKLSSKPNLRESLHYRGTTCFSSLAKLWFVTFSSRQNDCLIKNFKSRHSSQQWRCCGNWLKWSQNPKEWHPKTRGLSFSRHCTLDFACTLIFLRSESRTFI